MLSAKSLAWQFDHNMRAELERLEMGTVVKVVTIEDRVLHVETTNGFIIHVDEKTYGFPLIDFLARYEDQKLRLQFLFSHTEEKIGVVAFLGNQEIIFGLP